MTTSAQPAQFAQPGPGVVSGERVLVADRAMSTMLQARDVSLDGFDGPVAVAGRRPLGIPHE